MLGQAFVNLLAFCHDNTPCPRGRRPTQGLRTLRSPVCQPLVAIARPCPPPVHGSPQLVPSPWDRRRAWVWSRETPASNQEQPCRPPQRPPPVSRLPCADAQRRPTPAPCLAAIDSLAALIGYFLTLDCLQTGGWRV